LDSDLAESVSALKAIFERRKLPVEFGKADPALVEDLRKKLRTPARYRAFLLGANPSRVETACPIERVRLLPAEELLVEQRGFALQEDGSPRTNNEPSLTWRKTWIIVGRSSLLGDPYFLDVSKLDAEGDCPVYTAMSGTERWEPRLCASSFVQFLRILATSMEIAQGFGDAIMDDDDEASFREALGAKIKSIDVAALRAGHWNLGAASWRLALPGAILAAGYANAKCRMHSAKCISERSCTDVTRRAVSVQSVNEARPSAYFAPTPSGSRFPPTDMHFALCILHSAFKHRP
jgi:hypothetical protein